MWWLTALKRDGYAVVPDVAGQPVVADLVRALEAVRPGAAALDRGGGVYAMRNLLRDVPESRRLAESRAIRALVEPVLGPNLFAVRGLFFDKTAESNWLVPWHQDLTIAVRARTAAAGYGPWTVKAGVPHVQPPASVLEQMLTVRVQLDDGDAANGPLRVIPGSHSQGKLGAEAARAWLERTAPVTCVVPRGGALLMKPLLLHASSPSDAPGHRRVVHLEFAAGPLPGGVVWYEQTRVENEDVA
ncbi:MAG: phytanoyl-CoA dioxygenase family protein [Isosphaeraceae bacterium]|nr:phytanoyl-CoA dioxygenase family protein [Isosphaeraceae bacterium]